jgi:hypothetical protein
MRKAVAIYPDQVQPYLYLSQAYRALERTSDANEAASIFTRLSGVRMEKRDRESERVYVP